MPAAIAIQILERAIAMVIAGDTVLEASAKVGVSMGPIREACQRAGIVPVRGHRTRPGLKHGLSYTPEYRVWQTMRLRCTEPSNPAYASYGGRGITICPEWLDDPAAFIAHVGPKPSPAHEIDRRDNNRGYEPGNVRWATRKENDRNRRSNVMITFRGEIQSLAAWAEHFGIGCDTLGWRLRRGWDVERALTTPARAKRPNGGAR